MWQSQRDFQRVWEGGKPASWLSTLPYSVISMACFRLGDARITAASTSAMASTRKEVFVVIVVYECFGDFASTENAC